MSPREDVAQELLEICFFGGLTDSYRGRKTKETDSKGKTYWYVTFGESHELTGEIKIYSDKFIMISWNTAYQDLPKSGRELFKSVENARYFMRNFIRP